MDHTELFGARASIYLRKSRDDLKAEQNGGGDVLEAHRFRLLETANRMHLAVQKIYPEVVSGETIAARPQMQQLLHDLEAGAYDVVLVMEVSRLTRGDKLDQGIIQNVLKYTGVKIVTPERVYDPNDPTDEDMLDFGMFFSRFEWKQINKRQQAGMRTAKEQGKYICSSPPYGYQRQKLKGEKGWTLVPDPESAPIIKEIYRLFLEQKMSINGIARQMQEKGYPTARGGQWTINGIRSILRNPHYAGYIESDYRNVIKVVRDGKIVETRPRNLQNRKLYEGRHEPLVSKEDYSRAQAILATHKAPPIPKVHGMTNPLSGLLICGFCGKNMQRRNTPDPRQVQILCTTRGCPCVAANQELIVSLVLQAIAEWLKKFEVEEGHLEELVPGLDRKRTELAAARRQLNRQGSKLQRIYDLLESGVYTAEEFRLRKTNFEAERADLLTRIASLEADITSAEAVISQRQSIAPRMHTVLDTFGAATCLEQNRMLKSVLDHIIYKKTIKQTRANNETDLKVEIFPRFAENNR